MGQEPATSSNWEEPARLSRLREMLCEAFNLEEIQTICSDLQVSFDSLRGEGQAAKVRELVAFLGRQDRLDDLVPLIEKYNPTRYAENESWLNPSGGAANADASEQPKRTRRARSGQQIAGNTSRQTSPESPKKTDSAQQGRRLAKTGSSPHSPKPITPSQQPAQPPRPDSKWITWIHLSDLHFQQSDFYNRGEVLKALWRDISERATLAPELERLDFAVFTGDIAYHGKQSEYNSAVKHFFIPLLESTGLDWQRLFPVPGNHDVCWDDITKGSERITGSLTRRDDVTSLLETLQDRDLVFVRQQNYRAFFKKYFRHLKLNDLGYFYLANLREQIGVPAVLIGLNSSWSGKGGAEDRGKLVLGERQVSAALEQAGNSDLRIALMHHPFEWLQEENEDTVGVKRRLRERCDLLLSGHIHSPEVCPEKTLDGQVMRIPAGAIYDTRQARLSYNFVCFDLETKTGTVYLRSYNDRRGEWQRDTFSTGDAAGGQVSIAVADYSVGVPAQAEPARGFSQEVIAAITKLTQKYDTKDNREVAAGLLAKLSGFPGFVGEIRTQLLPAVIGLELLREPDLAEPLRSLVRSPDTPEEDKIAASQILLARKRTPARWIKPWPDARPPVSGSFIDWLELAELAFNPFGPENAQDDPLLPTLAVDVTFKARGAYPLLVFGQPGSGKTAIAKLLTHNCNDPLENPREPGAFPVYYSFQSVTTSRSGQRTLLEQLACKTADTVGCYLAINPNGFLELSSQRQKQLGDLLLTCAGSQESLADQLRQAAAPEAELGRLLRTIKGLGPGIRPAATLKGEDWQELLKGALPAEFKQLYALIDVTNVPRKAASVAADQLHSLLESCAFLAEGGIYLKVFLPEALRRPLGKINQINIVTLEWSKSELFDMLKERIRRASGIDSATGRDSLKALCDPDAQSIDVDSMLVNAAVTPRDLIRLGNDFLETHVANAHDEPLLSLRDIEMWQAKLRKSTRGREKAR